MSTQQDPSPARDASAGADQNPIANRMEPVMNVGKQCALYLGIVAALAAGVAFFGPFDHVPAIAQEQTSTTLEGEFDMLAPLDAPDGAPKDIAVFYVTGDAAQRMWDAFPMQPIEDECVGRLSKYGNGIVCYGANGDGSPAEHPYECSFGIDMKKQSLTLPQDC
ncbi:hypothetical protein [Dongia rigui]|uniref:Uncharacterized protein n=1 Tax=Dongia rigui TaxID=940149 RepID=A0ABU5DWN7_9PROT|nr:hypothetical protein [Dongia rigui]MDY0871707.1 hypothetical protein [Dongia rigui]